jgi:hypothetical protein
MRRWLLIVALICGRPGLGSIAFRSAGTVVNAQDRPGYKFHPGVDEAKLDT